MCHELVGEELQQFRVRRRILFAEIIGRLDDPSPH